MSHSKKSNKSKPSRPTASAKTAAAKKHAPNRAAKPKTQSKPQNKKMNSKPNLPAKPSSKTPSRAPSKPTPKTPDKAPSKASLSNEQRIKSALKKLTGNRNTPAIFKLPSKRHTPVSFSLSEIRELIKEKTLKGNGDKTRPAIPLKKAPAAVVEPQQNPRTLKSATLEDLLGGGKKEQSRAIEYDEKKVPAKFMPYFKKLVAMRDRLTLSVDERSQQTLKTSAQSSSGDLSSYGTSDAGTDTFDYDFALGLVSSEQEMMREIDMAIARIFDGSYGICEVTGRPISRDRLNAVPFTRFSKEGQDQFEKTRRRSVQRIGISSGEEDEEATASTDEEAES
jgi:RNA polymerase-binding transcription factor DksA